MKRRTFVTSTSIGSSYFSNANGGSWTTGNSTGYQTTHPRQNTSDKRSSSRSSSGSSNRSGESNTIPSIELDWRIYTLVTLAALGCYVNSLPGDFVHDDIPAIKMNKDVLGINSLTQMFRNDFWGTPMADIGSHKSYRPLTTLTFRANFLLFGLRPMWFHATNVILHAAACILFTRVCSVVAGLRRNFAAAAGIMFAVHPIHTEAVTGIVGRADVLACIFFLFSLLVYHGHADDPDSYAVWLSIALGGLSMLAKETGITVFLLNMAYDVYRCWPSLKRTILDVRWSEETHQFGRRVSRVLISMGVLLAVRLALLQGSLPKFSQQDNPTAFHPNLYVRLLTFCYLAAFNWWLVLCPSTLSHDWQMGSIPLLTSISDPRNMLTFVAFGAALLLAYRGIMDFEQQRHVPLVLGFLLLVLPFLPATNLVVTVGFVVAERVLYIPSLGCVLLVVYGAQMLWEAAPKYRSLLTLATVVLIAGGCCKTVTRNRDWYTRETLLNAGLAVLPHNAKMHYNLGNFLRDSSKHDLAILHYKQALSLWPTYASAHNNLGTLMPGFDLAEHHFIEAIRYSANHVNAHYNLGQLYRKSNRTSDAIRVLERCISLEPLFIPAYMELVKVHTASGQQKWLLAAGQLLHRVVKFTPRNPDYLTQYGNWLSENNQFWAALQQYQRALRVDETHQMALVGACRTLRKLGQRSRQHQVLLRWQLMVRIAKGGNPRQVEIYLHDWSIKHELRNRAMVYDTPDTNGVSLSLSTKTEAASTTSSTSDMTTTKTIDEVTKAEAIKEITCGAGIDGSGAFEKSTSGCFKRRDDVATPSYEAISMSSPTATVYPGARETAPLLSSQAGIDDAMDGTIGLRGIIREPNCNRSRHIHPLLPGLRTDENTAQRTKHSHRSASQSSETSSTNLKNGKNSRGRGRWPKSRHKHKGPPTIMEQANNVTPLLVPNLLDKL